MALFTKPVRIIDPGVFGAQMTLEQIQAAFIQGFNNPAVRAIGQIALAMREDAIGDSTSALIKDKPMEGALHSGAGNACSELAQIIADLSNGKSSDSIKSWFGD